MQITIAQTRPAKGRVEENLAALRALIARLARDGGTDLLLTPETAISGYFLEGGVVPAARTASQVVDALGPPPPGAPDLVLGFYERGRGAIHNSALHLSPDEGAWRVLHLHRKLFLPTYGIFDEARFVVPGTEPRSYETRFGRIGLLICEDMHHSLVPTLLALDGAEILLCLSATPARGFPPGSPLPTNLSHWEHTGRAIALEHALPLVVAHLAGSEGGRILAGGSVAYGPDGEVLARGTLFDEDLVHLRLDPAATERARIASPLLHDLRAAWPRLREGLDRSASGLPPSDAGKKAPSPPAQPLSRTLPDPDDRSFLEVDPELLTRALVSFLRDEVERRRGFRDVVLGLSGGVDSALVLLLAVRAFGAGRVHPLLLPYRTSSPESLEHAHAVAEVAGVRTRTIPITKGIDAYIADEEPELTPLRRGNLAARFRSVVLWDQSAALGALPLGTGNKSERLLGYFTWHADDAPPVNPLGDLFKSQVNALALHLGVPTEILAKPPSADLVEGVHDEDELGVRYEVADPILHWLLKGLAPGDLVEAGFDSRAVEAVSRRLEGTHWKRHLPTAAVVSNTAIGAFYLRPVDH